LQRLDEMTKIEMGFPQGFLASDHVHDLIFGETYAKVDNHRCR
jgi:hypothetical protein